MNKKNARVRGVGEGRGGRKRKLYGKGERKERKGTGNEKIGKDNNLGGNGRNVTNITHITPHHSST